MISGNEWYNSNEVRSYPIQEGYSKLSTSGIVLPEYILVDVRINTLADAVYVRSVVKNDKVVSVGFVSDTGPVACCTVPMASFVPYTNYKLFCVANTDSGYISFGDLRDKPNISCIFNKTAPLDDRCIIKPTVSAVTKLSSYRLNTSVQNATAIFTSEFPFTFSVDTNGYYEVTSPQSYAGIYHWNEFTSQYISSSGNVLTKMNGVWQVNGTPVTVEYWTIVYAGLHPSVMADFIGPCDKVSFRNSCGVPFVRFLGEASAKTDPSQKVINIVLKGSE